MATIAMHGKPYDLGLGWFRPVADRGADWVEHFGGGGGFWNVLRLYPERDLGVVVMGNTTRRWDLGAVADVLAARTW
jgi:CubicO group peptidase (beta-lactamase class C family)